jgi:hypothetical protein
LIAGDTLFPGAIVERDERHRYCACVTDVCVSYLAPCQLRRMPAKLACVCRLMWPP